MKPLCFVLMPFGTKKDKKGRDIDFNKIYNDLIKPAIEEAGLEPIRADEEITGGTIHKPMFERLILCEYAVADLTSLNANVFYELGLRHAVRPASTIPIYAFDAPLPFDLNMLRTLPYYLDDKGGLTDVEKSKKSLITMLKAAQDKTGDSPVFELVDGWKVSHNLSHEKTDVFRKQAEYNNDIKERLSDARNKDLKALSQIHKELQPLKEKESGVVVDLYLSYRDHKGYREMVLCYNEMDMPLKKTRMMREQLGFAYNRLGDHPKAEKVLKEVIEEFGSNPETNGILGRVYKDQYLENRKNNQIVARGYLNHAIKAYQEGFDADWRDAYPGVNLVTLLALKGDDTILKKYLPIVLFAVERKIAVGTSDYWDVATLLELSVINKNYDKAIDYLSDALALIPAKAKWMAETTLKNLTLILEERERRGEQDKELADINKHLSNFTLSEA